MATEKFGGKDFIHVFNFVRDKRKSGRILSNVKVGGVYISRLMVEPGVITGNNYHKKTFLMMYVESGSILGIFENINTKERKELKIHPAKQVIHIPPFVSVATKNIGLDEAVIVIFSNRCLRLGDDFEYQVL